MGVADKDDGDEVADETEKTDDVDIDVGDVDAVISVMTIADGVDDATDDVILDVDDASVEESPTEYVKPGTDELVTVVAANALAPVAAIAVR